MKLGIEKMPNTFFELPIYQPLQRKYWDWKEKKPQYANSSLGWMDLIEKTEPVMTVIDMRMVTIAWPFGDDHTVLETFRGGYLVELPFEKISAILLKLKL